MHFNLIEIFLVILFLALFVTVIFRHLHIPIILGYVLVGIIVGPNVLAWLPNAQVIKDIAEFGVVLMMFTVGLEFSFPKLMTLRRSVFVLGTLQVFFSSMISAIIGVSLGMPLIPSIIIGSIVSMSSTAIVVKQLLYQREINTSHGKNAIGILLFQDLAVIPILILIPSLSLNNHQFILLLLLWSAVKGLTAMLIIFGIGQYLLKPFIKLIAGTQVIELFTLAVLFISVGTAWFTNYLGLSYALGAFLAGMLLAECEFKEQITAEIRPFRDVLLGLFFISIGMLVNISLWTNAWGWIVLLLVGLTIGKGFLITMLSLIFKDDLETATRTGLVLAEGGEFGFAILTIALFHHLLPVEWGQAVLALLFISFMIAPILVRYNKKVSGYLFAKSMPKK